MTPFWASLFDHLKDCGRKGTIFIVALAGFFASLLFVAFIFKNGVQDFMIPILSGIALLLATRGWRALRQAQMRRNTHRGNTLLSRDELRAARSKLLREQNRKIT